LGYAPKRFGFENRCKAFAGTAAIAFPPKPIIPMSTVFKNLNDWGNGQVKKI
jgi:hypothetical protein